MKMIVVEKCTKCPDVWKCFSYDVAPAFIDGKCELQDVPDLAPLIDALENCIGELDALARANDWDYLRPDEDVITAAKQALAAAKGE